jgi:hypothetical protein
MRFQQMISGWAAVAAAHGRLPDDAVRLARYSSHVAEHGREANVSTR